MPCSSQCVWKSFALSNACDESISLKTNRISLFVDKESSGLRLDAFLAKALKLSRNHCQRLIDEQKVTSHLSIRKKHKLAHGEEILIDLPLSLSSPPALKILYEDEEILAIDKPPAVLTHPVPGRDEVSLVEALLAHVPTLPARDTNRPGIVHRLDRDTSGVLLIAKTQTTYLSLKEQFAAGRVEKHYTSICLGYPNPQLITAPLGRSSNPRAPICVVPWGRKSYTKIESVIPHSSNLSQLSLRIYTGRTHQIRVHLQHIGHPIVGDVQYGNSFHFSRQLLHASSISFFHPRGEKVTISAPLPQDFTIPLADALQQNPYAR